MLASILLYGPPLMAIRLICHVCGCDVRSTARIESKWLGRATVAYVVLLLLAAVTAIFGLGLMMGRA